MAVATDDGRETNENKTIGTQIEQYRADERDGERTPKAWFDVDDGKPVEVKSTKVRLSTGRRGRIQIEPDNHHNLLDHGGEYDILLRKSDADDDGTFDPDADTVLEMSLSAEELDELLREQDRKINVTGSKLKVSWADLFDPEDVPGESS